MGKRSVKKIFLPIALTFLAFVLIKNCSFYPLPKEKLSAIYLEIDEKYENDEYQLIINNTVDCPMRFLLSSEDVEVNDLLKENAPITLAARADTIIRIRGKGDLKGKIKYGVKWGDPDLPIRSKSIKSLPFPKGESYKLLQGNNSNPTHNTKKSRYAYDFTMKIGDTVTSVQDGFIVGVVEGYKGWGMSDKWKAYGNQVMVYDSVSHLFTMYGHLQHEGSLVELGDYVKIGQPIAISGRTGQTTEEHLHFNVFQADRGSSGLKSYPLDSIGGYKVKDLKRYQWMENAGI